MGGSVFVTVEEAKAAGLAFEDPGSERCPHCGRALGALGVELAGRVAWVSREDCGCESAARERAEKKSADAQRAAERQRSRERELLARAGVPRRYAGAAVDLPQVFAYIASFQGNGGAGLYIHGAVGRGKTYAASAIAREFLLSGYNVVFTTAKGMLESIKATFDGGAPTAGAVSRYAKCDLLVIDDLGKEDATEWSVGTVFSVLNTRYEDMRPTVVTSNYRLDELPRRLGRRGESVTGSAIASRIAETCTAVALSGPDRRTGRSGQTRPARPDSTPPRPRRAETENDPI